MTKKELQDTIDDLEETVSALEEKLADVRDQNKKLLAELADVTSELEAKDQLLSRKESVEKVEEPTPHEVVPLHVLNKLAQRSFIQRKAE